MKLTFVIPSQAKNKIVPIYLRLRDGTSTDIKVNAGILIAKNNWDNRKGGKIRLRSDFKDKDSYKAKLEGLLNFTASAVSLREGDTLSKEWLKKVIEAFNAGRSHENGSTTLFSFIQEFIEKSDTRINPKTGRQVDRKQRSEYRTTFQYLQNFAQESGKEPDFKDIDLDFYHDFVLFLQENKLAQNTIGRKIQTLKVFMNSALEEGKTEHQGHRSKRFIAPSEEPETVALTKEELTTLNNLDFSGNPKLDRVRDLFLVACWTGCRFGDLIKIKPDDIQEGLLYIRQSKTGNPVMVPLHPVVEKIFQKYQGRLPSNISNQKFNDYIKDLCKLAGFNNTVHKTQTRGGVTRSIKYKKWELITSHTGRRTFATVQYKDGFPTVSLMRITGHRTEASFLRYIRVSDEEHALRLRDFWIKNGDHLKIAK